MAYDPATNQLVLLTNNTTWLWNGTAWTQVDTTGAVPQNRNTFGMAYDPAAQAIIVFGSSDYNDTWAWNGTSWTQVADAGDPGCTTACLNAPPASYGNQMAYDGATSQMVLFGGGSYPGVNYNETWLLSYSAGAYTWAQVADAGAAGCTADCPDAPPGRNVGQMTYDPATRQLVLWGGELTNGEADGTNATWLWSGTSWSQVDDGNGVDAGCGASYPTLDSCPSSPPGRVGYGMAYDPALRAVVVFGGMNRFGASEYNDTWAWNGATWAQVDDSTDPGCGDLGAACTASPPARDTFAMTDDAGTGQLVVFGGDVGSGSGNDTWVAPSAAAPATPYGGAAVAATPTGDGYWVVSPHGVVNAFGAAKEYGSMSGTHLNAIIDGIASTPDGLGYWLVAADGGVFSFGDATFYGSMGGIHLNQPVVDIASTPDGGGYWLVGSDGGVFSFGDATYDGSMGGKSLNAPVVGIAATTDGQGYWLVGSDGGVFTYGDAGFDGSMGGKHLNAPIVGIASSRAGQGYLLVAGDGGIFNYGDAGFYGSAVGMPDASNTVGVFADSGIGYHVVVASGADYEFGTE
jgi:hypothetical protein